MKHLMRLSSLTDKEIMEILNLADQLKFERNNKIKHKILKGKTLGMLMNNPASSSRASFEVGMFDLGGHALMLSHNGLSSYGTWDSVSDYAAVLTRFVDAIAIRTESLAEAEAFAKGSIVPVINAKTKEVNPCQALADLMTLREYKGSFQGRKICLLGGGPSVASVIVGAVKMGMEVAVAAPENEKPYSEIMEWAAENGNFTYTTDLAAAAKDADVIYIEALKDFGDPRFTVTKEITEAAKEDVLVLHCLPVHRGNEITEEVFEKHQKAIYDQAENRMHVQKAILVKLLNDNK